MMKILKITIGLVLCAMLSVGLAMSGVLSDLSLSEIRLIKISSGITQNQKLEVKRKLREFELTDMSIDKLRSVLEKESWIHFVSVKKSWPDQLILKIIPHEPVAVFNNNAYINSAGEVFRSPFIQSVRLPHLYGPEELSVEMMSQFQKLNMALLDSKLYLTVLELNDRGVWRFEDQNGTEVVLGKHSITERLKRYLRIYDTRGVRERFGDIVKIDTRFSNGVSIEWNKNSVEHEIANNL